MICKEFQIAIQAPMSQELSLVSKQHHASTNRFPPFPFQIWHVIAVKLFALLTRIFREYSACCLLMKLKRTISNPGTSNFPAAYTNSD